MPFPPFLWRPVRPLLQMVQTRLAPMLERLQPRPLTDLLSAHMHSEQGVQLAAQPTRVHVLARGLCRFRWFDFAGLAQAEQLGFVRVQMAAWQPFAQTDWALVLAPGGAMVWAWDGAAWQQRCGAAGLPVQRAQVVPEPLLYAPPQGAPAGQAICRLQSCAQGWEGQCWRDGVLYASHWWAQWPGDALWLNFLRGAGAFASTLGPEPDQGAAAAQRARLPRPWGVLRGGHALQTDARLRWQLLAAGVLLPLLWASAYEWFALWQAQGQTQALERQQALLQQEAAPLLQARERVLANNALLQQLVEQVNQPTALQVMEHVQQRLRSAPALAGTIVRELNWGQGQLRLALQVPATAPRVAYVQALEGGGWLQDVRELPADSGTNAAWLVLQASAQGHLPGAVALRGNGQDSGQDGVQNGQEAPQDE